MMGKVLPRGFKRVDLECPHCEENVTLTFELQGWMGEDEVPKREPRFSTPMRAAADVQRWLGKHDPMTLFSGVIVVHFYTAGEWGAHPHVFCREAAHSILQTLSGANKVTGVLERANRRMGT